MADIDFSQAAPRIFPGLPRGRTGFDGGSEAGIAGRGAWPR